MASRVSVGCYYICFTGFPTTFKYNVRYSGPRFFFVFAGRGLAAVGKQLSKWKKRTKPKSKLPCFV